MLSRIVQRMLYQLETLIINGSDCSARNLLPDTVRTLISIHGVCKEIIKMHMY